MPDVAVRPLAIRRRCRLKAILKDVINHTRNIQGKGIERLPYPWWVSDSRKRQAATITRRAVHQLQAGGLIETDTIAAELIWRVVCHP